MTVSYRQFSGTAAENYQRHFVPAISTPVSVDLLRTADLKPGERVLDVACGTGLITRLAAEQVGPTGTVTGVDIAPDMIDVAKAVPAPVGSHIDWQVGDATALPFPDGSFDVVLCQMGLMFLEDRVEALREIRRVLTAGGRLVVNTPGSIQPLFELMEQAIVEHISPELGGFVRAIFSLHDPGVVGSLLRDAGLKDVSVDGVDRDVPASRDRGVPLAVHQPDTDGAVRRAGPTSRPAGDGTSGRGGSRAPRRRGPDPRGATDGDRDRPEVGVVPRARGCSGRRRPAPEHRRQLADRRGQRPQVVVDQRLRPVAERLARGAGGRRR